MSEIIRAGSPALVGNERTYILEALEAGQLSQGPFVKQFEEAFAAHIGRRHAFACANGSVALHLALLAIGLEPGDPVLVPSLTYVATANAIAIAGGVPVLVDVDPESWQIDPADARRRLEALRLVGRPAAGILPVHLYGVPAPMGPLLELAAEFDLWLVEDAAEAIGTTYSGRQAGEFGLASTFSFYGNKTLSTGEGGMVLVDDDELAARVALYRGQGQDPGRRYYHSVIGYNYRLGELAGAIGLAQVERVEWHVERRRQVEAWYTEKLSAVSTWPTSWQRLPASTLPGSRPGAWIFTVLLPAGVDRDKVAEMMLARGVETRPAFVPLHLLPPYLEEAGRFPVAEDVGARGLCLPTHANISEEHVDRVVVTLSEVLYVLDVVERSGGGLENVK